MISEVVAPDLATVPEVVAPVTEPDPTEPLKRKLSSTEVQLTSSKKRVKSLLQSRRRLKKRNAALKCVISDLKKQALVSSNSLDVLESCSGGVPDLLKRQKAKIEGRSLPTKYSPELRTFALTLNFYSPRAYRYVRKTFDTCLPHPRTLSKWYQHIDDAPGFTDSAFKALQLRSEARGETLLCSLIMDEISIRKHVEFDGRKYHGYIDMGTCLDDDGLPEAKDALVFMVVELKSSWKLPVGYFLINGLGCEERKNLVLDCIEKLYSKANVSVVALTHDGASANLSMLQLLGVRLDDPENIKPYFDHPVTSGKVHALLDPCHMLKLVRNTLAEKKALFRNDAVINWDYIVNLHRLQDSEGLHLANRLRAAHILWFKKKMNVRLAAQTFSESVASSLEFAMREKFPGFQGCEETITFMRIFDELFDVMNSRNLNAIDYKAPMQIKNYVAIFSLLDNSKDYILSLRQSQNGPLVLRGNRKTGFLGFLLCIESLKSLFQELVLSGNSSMLFLLTYKFSQDHIELFFGKIRSMGGCNNNPTARQFKTAYKKLMTHNDIQDVIKGNCIPLESIPILTASSTVAPDSLSILNSTSLRNRVLDPLNDSDVFHDHDYVFTPNHQILSKCAGKIVAYIAGFVCFKLKTSIKCETCCAARMADESSISEIHSLIELKSKSCLIFPSFDVIEICNTTERYFRHHVIPSNSKPLNVSFHFITRSVMKEFLRRDIFSNMKDHMFDTDATYNHLILLLKCIIEKYLKVRYHYAGRQYTAKLRESLSTRSRQVLNRLVIFSGQ